MYRLPDNVVKAIDKLRRSHKHHIEVKVVNNRCYVYESTSVWDRKRKSVRKISKYLGRIGGDGVFMGPSKRVPKLENYWTEVTNESNLARRINNTERYESQIIKAISMNGRISSARLAGILKKGASSADAYKKRVEGKYSIRYFATIYPQPLGFTRYIAFVNFLNKRPSFSELTGALSQEPLVQLALLSSGKYYLVLFILAKDNEGLNQLINRLKVESDLKRYDSEWYVGPRYVEYGTVPIRGQFVESLQEYVWKRTREAPRPKTGQLSQREFAVIKEVYNDGNVDFSDIDRKYGFEKGAARYSYQKLRESGIIHGITISMDKPGIKYSALLIITILNGGEFVKYSKQILEETIRDLPHINKYSYVCYIDSPYGIMFVMSVYDEKDLKQTEERFLRINGIKLDVLIVTDVFLGSFCYRKFDNAYSSQYKRLVDEYGITPEKEKVTYV
jgi:DNA-binding Lrp family transcriptional regulator